MSSNEWEKFKLSEIMEIIGGGTPRTNIVEYWNGNIPWLSVVDFGGEKKYVFETEKSITQLGLDNSSAKILKKGQIIISARGTVGELAILGKDMAFNQSCYGLNSKAMTSNDFLYYLLKYNIEQIKRKTHGAVFDTITRETFDHIEINLPPISTQRRIADILSALDDKIELNRQTNATLEAIAQAIFKEWFVNFNFPGATGELVESELGMIPKGWRVGKLEEMFDFLEGPGIRNWQYTSEGIHFLNIRLIEDNNINLDKANFIAEKEAFNKYSHFLLAEKDMIVSTSGTLGKTAIIRKSHLPLMLNTSIIRFRPVDRFSYPFMYQFLQSDYFLAEVNANASGSVQLNFGPSHLKRINMIIPQKEVVVKYSNLLSTLYLMIENNLEEISFLSSLRDQLLPKLMNGEIDVSN